MSEEAHSQQEPVVEAEEEQPAPIAREGDYVPPTFEAKAYHCPYCGVLAPMAWQRLGTRVPSWVDASAGIAPVNAWQVKCNVCSKYQHWVVNDSQIAEMVRPRASGAQRPHPQMPDEVRRDYEEARAIVAQSPRGACALLRLATEKLVGQLEPGSAKLDDKIGALVRKGLPEEVEQALDVLRVVGNNAVHPRELVLDDDVETATGLFECLNVIVEDRIARPKRLGGLFAKLPKGAREAIERRNAAKPQSDAPSDTAPVP